MSFVNLLRFGAVAALTAFVASSASAAPPPHAHPGSAHVGGYGYRPAPYPYYGGYRGVSIGIGVGPGYGYGLYGPLNYGLGGSPFGYGGVPYGGVGYGALGYGYGYPSTRTVIGLPATSGATIISGATPRPYVYIPPQSQPSTDPIPQPLPVPNSGKAEPATITVITSEGATVSFDGLASEQTGTRHSFTTKPIAGGASVRVSVKVSGTGGPASVSISVGAGEKATVDMRN